MLEKTFGLQRSDMSKVSGVSAGTKQTILRCRQGAADLGRSKYSGELLISTNIYFEGESKRFDPEVGFPSTAADSEVRQLNSSLTETSPS